MLQKLRLTKSDKYQLIIATSYITEMLVNFIQGKEYSLEIGYEQGGIPTWDDVVIINSQGVHEHIQVKRQTTDFCTKSTIRKRKQGNGNDLQDQSLLDKAMLGLANWVKENDKDAIDKKRKFIIELPNGQLRIKTNKDKKIHFDIRHFKDLCDQFNDNTTIEGLKSQKKICNSTENLYLWLTTWCGFDDWEHIRKAMLLLHIQDSGQENDINQRIETNLSHCFKNKKTIRKRIQGYIDENSNYASSITPRVLLQEFKDDLRTDVATWTQYKNTNNQAWSVIGTHDTRHRDKIEKPSQVVKSLWDVNGNRHLKIAANAPYSLDDQLPQSIVHLALHLPVLSVAFFEDLSAWKNVARSKVYTLGCSDSDLDDNQLSWDENIDRLASSYEEYPLTKSHEQATQAKALTEKMSEYTWDAVCKKLEEKNKALGDTDLRGAIEDRWDVWKEYFNQNITDRDDLLKKMLHPRCEGEDVIGSLRVGLRTVNILADGLRMLLIVSVALDKSNDQWNSFSCKIQVLALEYWSGLAGKNRQVDYLGDMADEVLGRESASILLLSKVTDSPDDIYKDTIVNDSTSQYNLNENHRPDLLVTNYRRFRRLIQAGDIDEIHKYLKKGQRLDQSSQEESIQRAAKV